MSPMSLYSGAVIKLLFRFNNHVMMFLGIGGSGRASATKLAAFMSDYELFQIEITKTYTFTDWREDVKKMLRKAGFDGVSTVFLFGDHQLKVSIGVKSVFEPSGRSDRRVSGSVFCSMNRVRGISTPSSLGMLVLFDDYQLKVSIRVKFVVFESGGRSGPRVFPASVSRVSPSLGC